MEPPDTKVNKILKKIMQFGWEECNLSDLAEVHQEVSIATDSLIRQCEVCRGTHGTKKQALKDKRSKIATQEGIASVKACDLSYKLKDIQRQETTLKRTPEKPDEDGDVVKCPCEEAAAKAAFEALPPRLEEKKLQTSLPKKRP